MGKGSDRERGPCTRVHGTESCFGQAIGATAPSMVKKYLAEIENDSTVDALDEEDHLKWAAATMFGGRCFF